MSQNCRLMMVPLVEHTSIAPLRQFTTIPPFSRNSAGANQRAKRPTRHGSRPPIEAAVQVSAELMSCGWVLDRETMNTTVSGSRGPTPSARSLRLHHGREYRLCATAGVSSSSILWIDRGSVTLVIDCCLYKYNTISVASNDPC